MTLDTIIVAVTSDDVVVRDPVTKTRVTTLGLKVKKTPFWLRRLRDGDVIKINELKRNIKLISKGEKNNELTI